MTDKAKDSPAEPMRTKQETRQLAELQALETARPAAYDALSSESKRLFHELRVHQIELELQNEELRDSQETIEVLRARYFGLYELAPVGYVTLTPEGVILDANLRFSSLVGAPRANIVKSPLSKFIFAADQDIFYRRRAELLKTGEAQTFELRMKGPDAAVFWARIEATLSPDHDSQAAFCRLTATDITEQRSLHAALADANRMTSMGLLAAGLAHEVNNPLTAVMYNMETLATQLQEKADAVTTLCSALDELICEDTLTEVGAVAVLRNTALELANLANLAEETTRASQRIHEVMKGLSSFSSSARSEVSAVDVNAVAKEAFAIVANEIRFRAVLVRELEPVPPVEANAARLTQVFVNLLVNAVQSIEEGHQETNRVTVHTWCADDRVCVEVSDTGCGIHPSNLAAVFEPFFTTKKADRGTGLGLAICRRIVEGFGGKIQLDSVLNRGTRVFFSLPVSHSADNTVIPEEGQDAAATTSPVVSARILVVDDDPLIRRVLKAILRRTHDVVVVESGRVAIDALQRDQRFDLILSDLMMEDISGIELHAWLVEHHPLLAWRLVFITGGVFTPRVEDYLGRHPNPVIQKPFLASELLETLHKLLAAWRAES